MVTDAGSPGISDRVKILLSLLYKTIFWLPWFQAQPHPLWGLYYQVFPATGSALKGFCHMTERQGEAPGNAGDRRADIIFYLSPHRTLEVLGDVQDALGNHTCAICRELTKKHEEILRERLKK